jgi:hypothetical protein
LAIELNGPLILSLKSVSDVTECGTASRFFHINLFDKPSAPPASFGVKFFVWEGEDEPGSITTLVGCGGFNTSAGT